MEMENVHLIRAFSVEMIAPYTCRLLSEVKCEKETALSDIRSALKTFHHIIGFPCIPSRVISTMDMGVIYKYIVLRGKRWIKMK